MHACEDTSVQNHPVEGQKNLTKGSLMSVASKTLHVIRKKLYTILVQLTTRSIGFQASTLKNVPSFHHGVIC